MAKSKTARPSDDLIGEDHPGIGHNGGPASLGSSAAEKLAEYIRRVENLEEQKRDIAGDISDLMKEIKGQGYDVRTVKRIIRERKRDAAEVNEENAMFDLYMSSIKEIL